MKARSKKGSSNAALDADVEPISADFSSVNQSSGIIKRRNHIPAVSTLDHAARRPHSRVHPVARKGGELIQLRVPGELTYRDLVTRAVTKCCKVAIEQRTSATCSEPPPEFQHEFVSAVGEAFNNVVIHAYDADASQAVTLVLRYDVDYVEVELRDVGKGFDPDAVPEPTLADLPEGGMGLFIMKSFVDEIRYMAGVPNVLVLRKYFTPR